MPPQLNYKFNLQASNRNGCDVIMPTSPKSHSAQHIRSLAQAVGMTDFHRILCLGYQAIQPVRDIQRFVETILLREQDRLDRIYGVS